MRLSTSVMVSAEIVLSNSFNHRFVTERVSSRFPKLNIGGPPSGGFTGT